MDPESKKLLEDTYALTVENNKMLHKVRNVQKWATLWSGLRILIIIGIAFGSFYFLEPYVKRSISVWDSIYGNQQKSNNTPLQDILKKIGI